AVAERDRWDDLADRGYVTRGGALVAWRLPDRLASSFRLVGAHTDSPGLRVSPRPDTRQAGFDQLGVEIYGGVLLNSWLDRDLGVAGRLVCGDGSEQLVRVDDAVARVPQLAIHLDRDVNERGLVLDRHAHVRPVWGTGRHDNFAAWVGEQAGIEPPQWWELCLFDTQPAAVLGADRSMLASGRIDNQVSCWAAVSALLAASPSDEHASLVALFDHEEVGSNSTTGAAGPLLEAVLDRLVAATGGDVDDRARIKSASSCISADGAHAVHPNYPERHDASHGPVVNGGPVIKVNANQRYATSASTAARFQRACEAAGCDAQVFVSRNNMPCGSTIGPLTATRLGIETADVGVAQLSMHSARELCGVLDPPRLRDALTVYFSDD
ncbi:MAG: M18 family aminopeptidase, partial [Actinomycetota bacterium]|nr:M18 family aminopeptidase [Actinomycetota bacterium]